MEYLVFDFRGSSLDLVCKCLGEGRSDFVFRDLLGFEGCNVLVRRYDTGDKRAIKLTVT